MGVVINLSHVDVDKMHAEEMRRRRQLLERARAGDVGALIVLRERYGLRLPLIETSLRTQGVQLPWPTVAPATQLAPDGRHPLASASQVSHGGIGERLPHRISRRPVAGRE